MGGGGGDASDAGYRRGSIGARSADDKSKHPL